MQGNITPCPRDRSPSAKMAAVIWLLGALMLFLQLQVPPVDCYYNRTKFKRIVYHDNSNDDAVKLNSEELIERSGFRYQEYYAVASDGYITQILRVINPKADPSRLKRPPVLMLHGSHLDTSLYLIASSIQHFPEPWPRKPEDGPMTSSNRSLAFALVNYGYDVWLIGSRGSNEANSAYTTNAKFYQAQQPHFKPDKSMFVQQYSTSYWKYGLDDIIKHELRNQIDLIRNITGMREWHYFSFSLSTISTMVFLAENPSYARGCRTFTQMAPVVAANHFTTWNQLYWEKIVPKMPTRGIGFWPSYFFDDVVMKNFIRLASYSARLRYSILYQLSSALFGPSPKYQTNLEKNALAHLVQPVSFKSAQQYGQSSVSQKFKYFDYGRLKNLFKYNKMKPPEHKLDRLEVQNYLIISGSFDSLADSVTIQRLKELTKTPTPVTHIIAPGFNHIDLVIGVEDDIYVNLPYIEYLNRHSDNGPVNGATASTLGSITGSAAESTTAKAAATLGQSN